MVVSIILVVSALMSGCKFNKLKFNEDSLAEEVVEYLIKKETGVDVDLTPESPEDESETYLDISPFDLV